MEKDRFKPQLEAVQPIVGAEFRLNGSELSHKDRANIQLEILNSIKSVISPGLDGLEKLRLRSRKGGDGVIESSYDLGSGRDIFVRIFEEPTIDRSFKMNILVEPVLIEALSPVIDEELSQIQESRAVNIDYAILPREDEFDWDHNYPNG